MSGSSAAVAYSHLIFVLFYADKISVMWRTSCSSMAGWVSIGADIAYLLATLFYQPQLSTPDIQPDLSGSDRLNARRCLLA